MILRAKTFNRDELITFNDSYNFCLEDLKDALNLMYSKKLILNCKEYCALLKIKEGSDSDNHNRCMYTLIDILTAEITRKTHYSRISQKWHNNKHKEVRYL